jgi:homoserine O-acetyltransferase/O-succinyltransferase
VTTPQLFDLRLADLPLERGGVVTSHHARGWWWGPEVDLPALTASTHTLAPDVLEAPLSVVRRRVTLSARASHPLSDDVPTVLLVHALTGDARAGGTQGWWKPLIGEGLALDPQRLRVLCFNNLGSNYGSTGPLDSGWPPEAKLTSIDQARALWLALDALGVKRVHLAAGGSLGGMVLLAMAALRPQAIERLLPIAATAFASAWLVGFNHVQRQALRLDPGFPADVSRGLELARQVAMLTYRAEPGLEATQSRTRPKEPGAPGQLRVEGYLEHQGQKLRARFDARAYLAQLDAMDSHDLVDGSLTVSAIRSKALVVDIDTDALFTPAQVRVLAEKLTQPPAERATLTSLHGHDAFLIELDQVARLLTRALAL